MFMQFTCEESSTESAYKYKHLSFVSCIFSFVAVIFCLFFFYIRYSSKIAVLRYDVKTVEADDYTVQLMVSKKQIQNFKLAHKKLIEEHKGSLALAFKHYLMDEISNKMLN